MTPTDREAARAALQQGRATYARLDQIRGPEDAAADIIDLWGAVESAMRSMLGGSVLSGQALVRELRQRDLIDLDQANALASFHGARTRVDQVHYKPTLTDVGYARAGYNQLANAVEHGGGAAAPAAPAAPAVPFATAAAAAAPSSGVPPAPPVRSASPVATDDVTPAPARRKLSTPVLIGIAAGVLVFLAIVLYATVGRSSYDRQMAAAVDLMRGGQTESARAAFSQIARDHPDQASPHVFLSRLARNDGDLATARQELDAAIRDDPANALALREMGLLLLAQNSPELARRFLVRAVQLAPSDSAAQGYLGCALLRLNRVEEGQRFLTRAGPGSWSSCSVPTVPGAVPGMSPPALPQAALPR